MIKEEWTEKIIQYVDGQASREDTRLIQKLLEEDGEFKTYFDQLTILQTELANDPERTSTDHLSERYNRWLDAYSKNRSRTLGSPAPTPWLKIAATILLLIVGGIVLVTMTNYYEQKKTLSKIQTELEETKRLVIDQLNNPISASQRITAVHASEEMTSPDEDIVTLLVKTINEDENSNVRMAALNALQKFYHHPGIKKALIESMRHQKDPVVQIALIQLLVQMKETSILSDLQKISQEPSWIKAVRDEAYQGIFKLT